MKSWFQKKAATLYTDQQNAKKKKTLGRLQGRVEKGPSWDKAGKGKGKEASRSAE